MSRLLIAKNQRGGTLGGDLSKMGSTIFPEAALNGILMTAGENKYLKRMKSVSTVVGTIRLSKRNVGPELMYGEYSWMEKKWNGGTPMLIKVGNFFLVNLFCEGKKH